MPSKIEYRKGQQINNLTFIKDVESDTHHRRAIFECYCGNEFESLISHIKSGMTQSCGCYKTKLIVSRSLKHGDAGKHYLYSLWAEIKKRCYNKNFIGYKYYGGRGIMMYDKWINDYIKFKSYILDNLGERPSGFTLDRKNNDGNYVPDNLRWATISQQNINQRPKKLTKKDVIEIRLLLSIGFYQKDIAETYGVTKGMISAIKLNKTHKI